MHCKCIPSPRPMLIREVAGPVEPGPGRLGECTLRTVTDLRLDNHENIRFSL